MGGVEMAQHVCTNRQDVVHCLRPVHSPGKQFLATIYRYSFVSGILVLWYQGSLWWPVMIYFERQHFLMTVLCMHVTTYTVFLSLVHMQA